MYTLLIVDDHKQLVESMAATTPWEEVGISRVLQAYSGLEAVQAMESETVHIVITDIRMPGMNGLELIETVRARWSGVACILLTGYAQFDYARRAIELQAINYLIKPVKDEELLSIVGKLTSELKRQGDHEHQARHAYRLNLPVLRKNMLNELLGANALVHKSISEKLSLYELAFDIGDPCRLLVAEVDTRFDRYSAADRSLIDYSVINIAEETFGADYDVWNAATTEGAIVFVLKEKRASDPEDRTWLQAARQFQSHVLQYLSATISLYLSPSFTFPDKMGELFREGVILLSKNAGKQGGLLTCRDSQDQHGRVESVKSLHQPPTFLHLAESKNWDGLWRKLNAVLEEMDRDFATSRLHLTEVYLHLLSTYTTLAHMNGYMLEEMIGPNPSSTSARFRTSEQLREWARTLLELIQERSSRESSGKTHLALIATIQQYIAAHLSENVTLQALADRVYLHPVYLSKMYKETTGINISEYILMTRMETARRLLGQTNDKIYEIAERIGYQSTQHFIREFKKYYGDTPKSYRTHQDSERD